MLVYPRPAYLVVQRQRGLDPNPSDRLFIDKTSRMTRSYRYF